MKTALRFIAGFVLCIAANFVVVGWVQNYARQSLYDGLLGLQALGTACTAVYLARKGKRAYAVGVLAGMVLIAALVYMLIVAIVYQANGFRSRTSPQGTLAEVRRHWSIRDTSQFSCQASPCADETPAPPLTGRVSVSPRLSASPPLSVSGTGARPTVRASRYHAPMETALRPFLIGTAGHVDHGKTTLVQAITGTNTDRLAEEQRRGMSIDLGFAEFHLPSGRVAGIVDVPGHERFLKNMLAGAAGVDFGVLVVAADEGVMPQTVEHLAIMQALQIPRGITVLTKADNVEADHLEIVADDVRAALAGTFLADAPILPVDSISGRGLDDLVRRLDETAAALPPHNADRPAFLPIDRVFQRPGFGLVVTGSLRAGRLREGDSVTIYPSGKPARVRGLQTFGQKEAIAEAGMRTAVNLAGVNTDELERGDIIAAPGSLTSSDRMNVLIEADALIRPIKHRVRVRLHIGTAEILARVLFWEGSELVSGVPALAQLHLEKPSAARRGDRFVLRWYSPSAFLGGGEVLEPEAVPFRARDAAVIRRLKALRCGSSGEIVMETLAARGANPTPAKELAERAGMDLADAEKALEAAVQSGQAVRTRIGFVTADEFRRTTDRWKARLAAYHKMAALRPGMPKDELRTQDDPMLPPAAFDAVLAALADTGEITVERDLARLSTHVVALRPDQCAAADEIVELLREAGWQPPYEVEITRRFGPHRTTRELWEYLSSSGAIVALAPGLFIHNATAASGIETVKSILAKQGSITVGEFRDIVGASRKYAVPFLEWCDAKRITRRDGDHRIPGPVS